MIYSVIVLSFCCGSCSFCGSAETFFGAIFANKASMSFEFAFVSSSWADFDETDFFYIFEVLLDVAVIALWFGWLFKVALKVSSTTTSCGSLYFTSKSYK